MGGNIVASAILVMVNDVINWNVHSVHSVQYIVNLTLSIVSDEVRVDGTGGDQTAVRT